MRSLNLRHLFCVVSHFNNQTHNPHHETTTCYSYLGVLCRFNYRYSYNIDIMFTFLSFRDAGRWILLTLNNVTVTLCEKRDYTTWRTLIKIRTLWHVDTACWFLNILIVADVKTHLQADDQKPGYCHDYVKKTWLLSTFKSTQTCYHIQLSVLSASILSRSRNHCSVLKLELFSVWQQENTDERELPAPGCYTGWEDICELICTYFTSSRVRLTPLKQRRRTELWPTFEGWWTLLCECPILKLSLQSVINTAAAFRLITLVRCPPKKRGQLAGCPVWIDHAMNWKHASQDVVILVSAGFL